MSNASVTKHQDCLVTIFWEKLDKEMDQHAISNFVYQKNYKLQLFKVSQWVRDTNVERVLRPAKNDMKNSLTINERENALILKLSQKISS